MKKENIEILKNKNEMKKEIIKKESIKQTKKFLENNLIITCFNDIKYKLYTIIQMKLKQIEKETNLNNINILLIQIEKIIYTNKKYFKNNIIDYDYLF